MYIRLFRTTFLTCLLLLSTALISSAQTLTAEDLLTAGGEMLQAKVILAGTYDFTVVRQDGEEIQLLYENNQTAFLPEEYRPSVGDIIKVIFFSPINASGSSLRNHDRLVQLIEPRRELPVPLGVWLEARKSYPDFRSAHSLFLPKLNVVVAVESAIEYTPVIEDSSLETPAIHYGDTFLVKLKAVPQSPGASNVYKLADIKPMSK